jgi:hypothetical protein
VPENEAFLSRPDVKRALDDLVDRRLGMTEEGHDDAQLPEPAGFLREQGIEIPDGTKLRLVRTVHESDVQPLSPLCDDGQRATPVNCRWIGKHFVCDWVCP